MPRTGRRWLNLTKIILSAWLFAAVLSGSLNPGGGQFLQPSRAEAAGWNISAWKPSTDEWRQKLGINYRRSGWTGSPEQGVANLKKIAAREPVDKFFLSIYAPKKDPTAVELRKNALTYSQLSLGFRKLEEIGMDDFLDKYRFLAKRSPNPAAILNEVINNTKKYNPNLKFGITLYVDQLNSPWLSDAKLPSSLRNRIDYVHLFIHNRTDGPDYAAHVARAKRLFPHAKIIAGAYPFDRIDYVPAVRHDPSRRKCTPVEEIGLFEQTLEIQARLLREGQIEAIEFYPGNFGMEEKIVATHGKCAPARRQQCLQHTKQMSAAAVKILNKYKR